MEPSKKSTLNFYQRKECKRVRHIEEEAIIQFHTEL